VLALAMTDNSFLHIVLEFESSNKNRDTGARFVENNIVCGLKSLFGEVGAAIPFTLIKLSEQGNSDKDKGDSIQLVISCPTEFLVKLRSAITLQGQFHGESCCYWVKKVSKSPHRVV